MTFDIMVPYLNGFHLTLAAHLKQRDADGWKMSDSAWKMFVYQNLGDGKIDEIDAQNLIEHGCSGTEGNMDDPPTQVTTLTQPVEDIEALADFLSGSDTPIMTYPRQVVQNVRCGFGDESGIVFGATLETEQDLKYQIGVWGSDDEDENFKELEIVASTIEEAEHGTLTNSMLYF
jgi:hypothetical protein